MARNKYPEQTVKKILEVSFRLFREKGYDHTTIQDITGALGMSKGAIYHHFKSKEEILDRITDTYYDTVHWFDDVRRDPSLSGLEKLREILRRQFSDPLKHEIDLVSVSLKNNPRLITMVLESTISDAAPFFQQLVEEGIADGSIASSRPKELSEALLLLLNLWVGVFAKTREDFAAKMSFLREFTDRMGLPLLDDELMRVGQTYYDVVMQKASAAQASCLKDD